MEKPAEADNIQSREQLMDNGTCPIDRELECWFSIRDTGWKVVAISLGERTY
jgi:hypothetical protein